MTGYVFKEVYGKSKIRAVNSKVSAEATWQRGGQSSSFRDKTELEKVKNNKAEAKMWQAENQQRQNI